MQERASSEDENATMIRVALADDHPLLRAGVISLLSTEPDIIVVGEASDGEEAIALYAKSRPDILILDLQMPNLTGIDVISKVLKESPRARIIVLTTYAGDAQATRALRLGVIGYILKTSVGDELVKAIRTVYNGRKFLSPEVAREIATHFEDQSLTPRERDVLTLAADGNSNKQISAKLSLSEDTVKGYMRLIFAKLGASDRTHAVTLAMRRGIIDIKKE
jgi:DNA-binding NarL/FixJ family response regulator